MDLIGLIPAAGRAKRLPMLPCSKEIYPIGTFSRFDGNKLVQYPKPIISYMLERFSVAGVNRTMIITNKEKSDILRFLGDGNKFDMDISYLVQEENNGMPCALNLAYPWTKDAVVLFGMPDTIFFPENGFKLLLDKFFSTQADLTLGLFPTENPSKFGMVDFDAQENFLYTVDKPDSSDLMFMWGIACWNNSFQNFLKEFIDKHTFSNELVLGLVIQAAHESGLRVNVLPFTNGKYIDIGTPEDLQDAIQRFTCNKQSDHNDDGLTHRDY